MTQTEVVDISVAVEAEHTVERSVDVLLEKIIKSAIAGEADPKYAEKLATILKANKAKLVKDVVANTPQATPTTTTAPKHSA